ncbi:hypothetical protein OG763_45845 (plasmid) [Streptomyces sp. NBC_01230]|uniref:hypothetical protein n=1 Tax=Streptomyces sp. NBC_01527 TaxID=2903894 RepID=UPI002F90BE2C|nr:hypothetical protein OG763_45845 [Streptomyces sp. NBC_01230]
MGDDKAVSLDLSNYELRWPTSLFVAEGERILQSTGSPWEERAKRLLTEALVGTTAVADFEEIPSHKDPAADPWATTASRWGTAHQAGKDQCDWFDELIKRATELRQAAAPRPYWPRRHGSGLSHDDRTPRETRQDFARLIGEYCVDDHDDLPDASEAIERRLGIPDLWPLAPETWDEETFYGLIEVLHDLVSRPRKRWHHSHGGCGWHHSEFHNGPARILYRCKVNQLLREAGIEYEPAAEGEDLGRLVAVTDDARSALVHRARNDSAPDIMTRIRHAIALFRGHDTTVESKRSAIVTLAGVLEERRALIKDHIGKHDDWALFEIANRYDLRHRNADQRGDYDEAFMDCIFWRYLATVELTTDSQCGCQGRLMTRCEGVSPVGRGWVAR